MLLLKNATQKDKLRIPSKTYHFTPSNIEVGKMLV